MPLRALLVFLIAWPALAEISPGIYGVHLRAFLHHSVRNHKVIPYSSTRFDTSDDVKLLNAAPDDGNSGALIYCGKRLPKADFGLSGGWNRDHLWPNSYGFDGVEPAFSDLKHLRAVDSNVNSSRGNEWYDLSDPAYGTGANPGHTEAPGTSADPNPWKPPPEHRGDIARALFYMDVRYEDDVFAEPNLRLSMELSRIGLTNT